MKFDFSLQIEKFHGTDWFFSLFYFFMWWHQPSIVDRGNYVVFSLSHFFSRIARYLIVKKSLAQQSRFFSIITTWLRATLAITTMTYSIVYQRDICLTKGNERMHTYQFYLRCSQRPQIGHSLWIPSASFDRQKLDSTGSTFSLTPLPTKTGAGQHCSEITTHYVDSPRRLLMQIAMDGRKCLWIKN